MGLCASKQETEEGPEAARPFGIDRRQSKHMAGMVPQNSGDWKEHYEFADSE